MFLDEITSLTFLENTTSRACLFKSGLKDISTYKPTQILSADSYYYHLQKSNDVSSAKSSTVDSKFMDKSLMQIRKESGPRMEPCDTPV